MLCTFACQPSIYHLSRCHRSWDMTDWPVSVNAFWSKFSDPYFEHGSTQKSKIWWEFFFMVSNNGTKNHSNRWRSCQIVIKNWLISHGITLSPNYKTIKSVVCFGDCLIFAKCIICSNYPLSIKCICYSNYHLDQIIRQWSLWSALVTASYLLSVICRLIYLQLLTSLIFTP